MQPQTSHRSATPAPVLLSGFALVSLAVVLLGYRMLSVDSGSGLDEALVAIPIDLGELTDARSMAFERRLLHAWAPLQRPTTTGRAWSSGAHPIAPEVSAATVITAQPRTVLEDLPPAATLATGVITTSAEAAPFEARWASSSHSLPLAALPSPASLALEPDLLQLGERRMTSAGTLPSERRTELPGAAAARWSSRAHSPGPPGTPQGDLPVAPQPAPAPRPEPRAVVARVPEPRPNPPIADEAWARGVTRGEISRPQVLLSFDGGSSASSATAILDILRQEGVQTTLFLTGSFIRSFPGLVHQALADGHEVGNHTDTHLHLTTWAENRRHLTRSDLSRQQFLGEMAAAHQAFFDVTGREMAPFWRAPYGEVNQEIRAWAASLGYLHVGWTQGLDSLDWVSDTASPQYRTPQEFLTLLDQKSRSDANRLNGAIVLMHLHSNRPPEQRFDRGLVATIRWLRTAGYRLVPASVLTGFSAPTSRSPGGPVGS